MKPIIGPPVRGDDLRGRGPFIDGLWERLELNGVLLVAPRRFGKTSVMHALCDEPRRPWSAVYLDAEHITTPAEFAVGLIRKCWEANPRWQAAMRRSLEEAGSWCRALVSGAGVAASFDTQFWLELRRDMRREWEPRSAQLLKALRSIDTPVVLVVDELAVMLDNFAGQNLGSAEVCGFMRWFRHARIDPSDGLRNCRFVLGSSIGIEGALSRIGAVDTINDLQPVVLPALTPEDGRQLLMDLLADAKITLSPQALRKALVLIGPPVPYLIQVMADVLINASKGASSTGPRWVEGVYREHVLGVHGRTYFEHYYDRLRRLDPLDHNLALVVLRHLAGAGRAPLSALWQVYAGTAGGARTADDLRALLYDLENDFYIRYASAAGEYVFWSNMLRDWWRRHYSAEV